MKTQFIDLDKACLAPKGSVLSLGGFDGIHLGHQSLIKKLLGAAKKRKAPSCLCLFDPLPFQVLKGQSDFKRIFTIEEIKGLLEPFGLDFFCVAPFDIPFSKLSPLEFARSFIFRHFKPIHIVAGYDFFFAHQRAGDFSALKALGARLGWTAERAEAYLDKGRPVSSSQIRKALAEGRVEELKASLGRPFFIQARAVKGEGRGRRLGFPTVNLQPEGKELPLFGVYGGRLKAGAVWHEAVVNIGCRPTFGKGKALAEAHILSGAFEPCGRDLKLELNFFIRRERAFPGASKLIEAIKKDINRARAVFSKGF